MLNSWTRSDDSGSSLIATILVGAVVLSLGVLSLRTAMHTEDVTAVDRMRVQSLHAAEAGVNTAIHRLQMNNECDAEIADAVRLSAPSAIARYQVRIDPEEGTSCDSNERVIRSWGYAPEGSGRSLRHLEVGVRLIPHDGFQYSLFASGSQGVITTHNTPTIQGDVYAESLDQSHNNLDADSIITPGSIDTKDNASYSGILWAGGNIILRQNGTVGGSITASGTSGAGNVQLENGVVVARDVRAAGSVTLGGTAQVHGSVSEGNSTLHAPPNHSLPAFTYDGGNYDPPPVAFPSAAAARTHLMANNDDLKGTLYIPDTSGTLDLTFIGGNRGTVTGPLTIITDGRVNLAGTLFETGGRHQVVIISRCTGTDCITIDKPTTVAPGIDLLLYTLGELTIKNQVTFTGAVYADKITVRNNATITRSSSLANDPPPGFSFDLGSAQRFTVVPVIWRELSPTPPLP